MTALGMRRRHRALLHEEFSTGVEEEHTECAVHQPAPDVFVLVTCEGTRVTTICLVVAVYIPTPTRGGASTSAAA